MNLITVSPLEKSILPLIKRGLLSGLPPIGGPPTLYQCANNNNWDHHQKEYYRHMENYLLHIQLQ
jgi:hypothetical protein